MGTIETKVDKTIDKMEKQVKVWRGKLAELAAKADIANDQFKDDYNRRVEELKIKVDQAQAKLDEIRSQGSERWDKIRTGLDKAWSEIEATFKDLK